jgi:hypothetical protein
MNFVVKMMPDVGDKHVSKATIIMYDANGVQQEGQFLLEAETAETKLTMPPGGRMEVKEHERRDVFDMEQKAAVPIGTAEREVKEAADRPTATPHKDDKMHPKVEEKKSADTKLDMSKNPDPSHRK